MADVANKKRCGKQFGNASELIEVIYDFSVDAGATGDLSLLEAESDCIVHLRHALVQEACTSDGLMTLDVGKTGGDEFIGGTAVAALTLDSLHVGAAPVELTAGEKIDMGILTAALTAGKVKFVFEVFAK